jgi:hypothetical protein
LVLVALLGPSGGARSGWLRSTTTPSQAGGRVDVDHPEALDLFLYEMIGRRLRHLFNRFRSHPISPMLFQSSSVSLIFSKQEPLHRAWRRTLSNDAPYVRINPSR